MVRVRNRLSPADASALALTHGIGEPERSKWVWDIQKEPSSSLDLRRIGRDQIRCLPWARPRGLSQAVGWVFMGLSHKSLWPVGFHPCVNSCPKAKKTIDISIVLKYDQRVS